jgi:hypothetical protein
MKMSNTNGTTVNGTESRIGDNIAKADADVGREPNDLLADLLSRLGSKGRIKGTLIVKGVETAKGTLRGGLKSYTEEEFDTVAKANGIDVTRQIDVTFHGVFRGKSHTDRVVGDNALEFIADLKEANETA